MIKIRQLRQLCRRAVAFCIFVSGSIALQIIVLRTGGSQCKSTSNSKEWLTLQNFCVHRTDDGIFLPAGNGFQDYLPTCPHPLCRKDQTHAMWNASKVVKGKTYFMNCWRQEITRMNPSHWMNKVGLLYSDHVKCFHQRDRFDNLAFHQCPDPNVSSWRWANDIWKWSSSHVSSVRKVWLWFFEEDFVCFEKAVVDLQYAKWFYDEQNFRSWRQEVSKQIGIPEIAFLGHRKAELVPEDFRIAIFERKSGNGNRKFINLNNVKDVLKQFTMREITVLGLDGTEPAYYQAALFRQFDMLISPHGSHMTNYIFSDQGAKFIEVVPSIMPFNNHWIDNAKNLGIQSYLISYGNGITTECAKRYNLEKTCVPFGSVPGICLPLTGKAHIYCDVYVNLTALRERIHQFIGIKENILADPLLT